MSDNYNIQKKSQNEHAIDYNPGMYIGSVDNQLQKSWLYCPESNRILRQQAQITVGFLNLFEEIFINAIDNQHRGSKNMSFVKVAVDDQSIAVENDGETIPVILDAEENAYLPQLVFSRMYTSSNYVDERLTAGQNGMGAKIVNLFSTKMQVQVIDIKQKQVFKQSYADNMSVINPAEVKPTTKAQKSNLVRVQYWPDFKRFGMTQVDEQSKQCIMKRIVDAASLNPNLKFWFNGTQIKQTSFEQYAKLYLCDDNEFVLKHKDDNCELIISFPQKPRDNVSFVNNLPIRENGTHVDSVVDQIYVYIKEKYQKININKQYFKQKLWICLQCRIKSPSFNTQSKEKLTTPVAHIKKVIQLPTKFMDKIATHAKKDLMEEQKQLEDANLKKTMKLSKPHKKLLIPKLDDANKAGTSESHKCTLILTEGDSAKALALAGLQVVGRDYYGAFPLKGKPLNVRQASTKEICNNKEIQHIIQIIGLDIANTSADPKKLRYGSIMIMSDQDLDGAHIKGLIINFIHFFWPQLALNLQTNFMKCFITPLVKVKQQGQQPLEFYNVSDFNKWRLNNTNVSSKAIKYYKGLGTSTTQEAKQYFARLDKHVKTFVAKDNLDEQLLNLAFQGDQCDQRKDWIAAFDKNDCLDYGDPCILYSRFINTELVQFARYSCDRSLPSLCDGLKPGQRKIIYACFKKGQALINGEIKVAQLSGYVAQVALYHHGEDSLNETISKMAQNYVGTNNINLLMPNGQFGNRNQGKDGISSPRYIFTQLNKITRFIFHPDDDHILNYLEDDGQLVEPEYYAPVVPMLLVNGASGIGTGWSSSIPSFNIKQIIKNIRMLFKYHNKDTHKMIIMNPYFRGFKGIIQPINNDTYSIEGTFHIQDKNLVITEIPPEICITKYKKTLDNLIEKNTILSYSEQHQDEDIKFIVKGWKGDAQDHETVLKTFKLKTTLQTSNLVVVNPHGKIVKYENQYHILVDYFQIRLNLYQKRKEDKLQRLENEKKIIFNKHRFIQEYIENKFDIKLFSKQQLEQYLADQNYDQLEGSFKYIIKVPVYQLTTDQFAILTKQLELLEIDIITLQNTTPQQLWERDLTELEQQLELLNLY